MKNNTSYIVSYLFTLIVGILLLAYWNAVNIFQIIIIIIGVCFLIPSLIGIFMGFSGKKNPDGTRSNRPWYIGVSSIAGLVGGVLLVAIPNFFVHYLIYTFGVILIVAGFIQILFLSIEGRDIGGMARTWFILPWLTVATGIAVIIIGPESLAKAATIVTGIALTLYSLNGLFSASAHKVTKHKMARASASAEALAIEAESSEKTEAEEAKSSENKEASETAGNSEDSRAAENETTEI